MEELTRLRAEKKKVEDQLFDLRKLFKEIEGSYNLLKELEKTFPEKLKAL